MINGNHIRPCMITVIIYDLVGLPGMDLFNKVKGTLTETEKELKRQNLCRRNQLKRYLKLKDFYSI